MKKRQIQLLKLYFLVLLGVGFIIIGILSLTEVLNITTTLEEELQFRLYLFLFLTILFLFNGFRILSRYYKDKIKGK